MIDDVEVKRVRDLSPRDIEHDNPEFRRLEETLGFLRQIYGRDIEHEDTVTVIRFSQVVEVEWHRIWETARRRRPATSPRSMSEYSFLTTWCLEAPREPVWDAIWDSESWPQWWRGVTAAEKLADGDEDGVGQVGRYSWRSKLPYDLDFR